MTALTQLPGMLAFRSRALRAQARRQSSVAGVIWFSAGFLVFSAVRNAVYSALPDFGGGSEPAGFLLIQLIRVLTFALVIYIPALAVLGNAFAGDSYGVTLSREEYKSHASVLLPLWGLLFLIDAPLQYFAPQFLVIGVFGITVGMLVLLILLCVYTVWAVKQLNYLSALQSFGVFAVSWFTLPVYFLLVSFLFALPFFILLPTAYFGVQWLRARLAVRAREREFQQHLQALTRNPQDADAHYQLGLIHLRRGSLEVARRYFENAVKIDPSDPDYHFFLRRVHEGAAEWGRALERYQETYRLNPNYGLGDILREVGKACLHTGDTGKGIEFLRLFLEKRNSDPEGRYWLAVALRDSDDARQMRVELNTILDQARSSPRFFRKENREWFYRARSLLREVAGGRD